MTAGGRNEKRGEKRERFKRYTSSDVHWRLIEATAARDKELDAAVSDDGFVPQQALFCPYYATLEGTLGSDWGVIVNPESVKFGQLVFEHHWCGCPSLEPDPVSGEVFAQHGSGKQTVDEWRVAGCRDTHEFRDGGWDICNRPKGHTGKHRGRRRSWLASRAET